MSNAATVSFHTVTRTGSCAASSDRCSASMPGARSTSSEWRKAQRTSAMRGSRRCETKRPCASTTIQARSNSSPVSITTEASTSIPAHDLIGCTRNARRRSSMSPMPMPPTPLPLPLPLPPFWLI